MIDYCFVSSKKKANFCKKKKKDKFQNFAIFSGMTPLHVAILHGQINTVRYLLAKYPFCVNATNHVIFLILLI